MTSEQGSAGGEAPGASRGDRLRDEDGAAGAAAGVGETLTAPRRGRPVGQMRLTVVAAVAALLGAAIGATAGFAGTVYQSNSQRSLTLRQERLTAYADMNLAFNRFLVAPTDKRCARADELQTPYATILLLSPTTIGIHAEQAVQASEAECADIRAGKINSANSEHFRSSVASFIVSAQEDLAE
jgi:hypothetical protein